MTAPGMDRLKAAAEWRGGVIGSPPENLPASGDNYTASREIEVQRYMRSGLNQID
jgi:hypothetical protein